MKKYPRDAPWSRFTEKTRFPFPSALNGIWLWRQFSCRFWTKWNSIWFRKSTGKLSPRSYPIQCERKWKYSFLIVAFLARLETLPRSLVVFFSRTGKNYWKKNYQDQLSERLACLGIMGAMRGPSWNSSDHHSNIVLRGLEWPLIMPTLFRERLVSRTADVIFTSLAIEGPPWNPHKSQHYCVEGFQGTANVFISVRILPKLRGINFCFLSLWFRRIVWGGPELGPHCVPRNDREYQHAGQRFSVSCSSKPNHSARLVQKSKRIIINTISLVQKLNTGTL